MRWSAANSLLSQIVLSALIVPAASDIWKRTFPNGALPTLVIGGLLFLVSLWPAPRRLLFAQVGAFLSIVFTALSTVWEFPALQALKVDPLPGITPTAFQSAAMFLCCLSILSLLLWRLRNRNYVAGPELSSLGLLIVLISHRVTPTTQSLPRTLIIVVVATVLLMFAVAKSQLVEIGTFIAAGIGGVVLAVLCISSSAKPTMSDTILIAVGMLLLVLGIYATGKVSSVRQSDGLEIGRSAIPVLIAFGVLAEAGRTQIRLDTDILAALALLTALLGVGVTFGQHIAKADRA